MAAESIYGLLATEGSRAAPGPRVVSYKNMATTQASDVKVKMHVDSSQMESVLNPVRGVRDAQLRAGIKPVNHSRHNVLSIKEQSRLNALRRAQEVEEAEELEAARREGRPVRKLHSTATSANSSRPGSQGGLRAHRRSSLEGGGTPGTGSGGKDFVLANRLAAAAAAGPPVKAEARSDPAAAYLAKPDYGRVPQYLRQRQAQMAADYEAQLAAKEAALIPAGMRLLPEAERRETLAILAANRTEVERAVAALPIIIETPGQVRRKEELERRLHEIEDAARVFGRSKVLVRAD